jgi:hypothetical protein
MATRCLSPIEARLPSRGDRYELSGSLWEVCTLCRYGAPDTYFRGTMIFEDQLESVERASYDKGDDYVNLRC